MKAKYISQERLRLLLEYNPVTGIFHWLVRPAALPRWNTRYAGRVAGYTSTSGYTVVQIGRGQNYSAHRLAWIYVNGDIPDGVEIDHIDGARGDNRIANLRLAPQGANAINKAMQRNNTSGYVGVQFHPETGKWRFRVTRNKKSHTPGRLFDTAQEAAEARAEMVKAIHGEFAVADPHRPRFFHERDRKRAH